MKGTAILYQHNLQIKFIENIERAQFEVLQKQIQEKKSKSLSNVKIMDVNQVSPILWHEDDVDWDYGY